MENFSPTSDDFLNFDGFDFWRLCDELSVAQAALLTVDVNPECREGVYCEDWKPEERPIGYEAAKTAIVSALKRGKIEGTLVPLFEHDINGNNACAIEASINVKESMIDVESLRSYFQKKGLKSGFFATQTAEKPDYLDPTHPRFAPKLAASIGAWIAVTNPGKKSPKQALEKWLREHAAEYGLVDDDGNPVNQAVEDCSKVANWSQTGGAPKSLET